MAKYRETFVLLVIAVFIAVSGNVMADSHARPGQWIDKKALQYDGSVEETAREHGQAKKEEKEFEKAEKEAEKAQKMAKEDHDDD